MSSNLNCSSAMACKPQGFSLIELLIALAIVGIIAAIAVPSYSNFVARSKMRTAQGDLVSLSVNIENAYQRLLAYPAIAADADLTSLYAGWAPASSGEFTFSAVSNSTSYRLTASGQGALSGCTITLESGSVRDADGCPQGDGDWI